MKIEKAMNMGTNIQKIPVGDINVDGVGIYRPLKNITAYEVAMLLRLFITSFTPNYVDYKAYIIKHKLERHFS